MPTAAVPRETLETKRFSSRRPLEIFPPGQQERHIFMTLAAPVPEGNPGPPHYNDVFKPLFISSLFFPASLFYDGGEEFIRAVIGGEPGKKVESEKRGRWEVREGAY